MTVQQHLEYWNCPQLYWAFLVEYVWFLFWWCPLLSADCFHKLCLSGTPRKIVRRVEILGIGWPGVIGLTRNEFVPWEVMPEVFKCSVREMRWHLIFRTDHLKTSGIPSHGTDSFCAKLITPGHLIPKISTRLTIFWGRTWKKEFVKRIHRQERTSSEEKSDGFHKTCSIELWTILMFKLLLCYHTAAYSSTVHATNIVSITEKV